MNDQVSTTMFVERDGKEIEVEITGNVDPFVHGVFSGPPERCFPNEGGYAELEEALFNGNHFELTQEEMAQAETLLYEAYEDDVCDYDDLLDEDDFLSIDD